MSASAGEGHRVLIEGHNLTLAAGTGIATYARRLAATLRGLGYETELLAGSPRGVDRKDPVLAQISLFDAYPSPRLDRLIGDEIRRLTVGPFAANREAVASELEALFGLTPGDYFLFVGAFEPKKNVSRLIDAYAASGSRVRLSSPAATAG